MQDQTWEDAREEACEILLKPDTKVTINGNPARVGGFTKRFATVTDGTTLLGCEYAWETVLHILKTRNGAFSTI